MNVPLTSFCKYTTTVGRVHRWQIKSQSNTMKPPCTAQVLLCSLSRHFSNIKDNGQMVLLARYVDTTAVHRYIQFDFLISKKSKKEYYSDREGQLTNEPNSFDIKDAYTNSLVNTDSFHANLTNTTFQKIPIPHLTCTRKQKFLH